MMRHTVARAFAPEGSRVAADPAAPRDRLEAVRRLFLGLHAAFTDRLSEGGSVEGSPASRTGPAVGPIRSLLEGVEFELRWGTSAIRFLNTLDAKIWVHEIGAGARIACEILSVGGAVEEYRPICKTLRQERTGYQLTSVRQLADFYVGRTRPDGSEAPECLKD